ncbi:MAG TPA: hypothetical protein VJL83_04635 [Patescibacteria group bacterium]|nr:hypothetical protein [Patescibacteria group bacterium]
METIEVIPGIFEKDFQLIRERAKLVAPFIDWIHIDIADNRLVSNSSFLDPSPFKKLIQETGKKFELHMMIDNPVSVSDEWVIAGFQRLLWHMEGIIKTSDVRLKIAEIRGRGVEVGLAVDKETPVESVLPYLDDVDCVLVMTIQAGFSGQQFIPEMLDKARVIRERKPGLPIEVDGGINDETARMAVVAGATRLVSTSYIFNSGNIREAINRLQRQSSS